MNMFWKRHYARLTQANDLAIPSDVVGIAPGDRWRGSEGPWQ